MRFIVVFAALFALVVLVTVVVLEFQMVDPQHPVQLDTIHNLLLEFGAQAWQFAKPLLQLIVVLTIVDWLLSRLGVRIRLEHLSSTWNVQTFIAGMIISTFCIAVLANIPAVGYLKDVVLIVIGFYFGTRAKPISTVAVPVPVGDLQANRPGVSIESPGPDIEYEDSNPFGDKS